MRVLLHYQSLQSTEPTPRFVAHETTNAGRINVSPENNPSKNYSFADNNAPAGDLFYRLKMVSKDGTFTYIPVEVVKSNCGGKGNVLIDPTKSNGRFNIELAPGY